jgi:mono/diheme cytochrome c family protein
VAFVGIQLVPYGRAHTNPPIAGEPAWDAPATRALAKQACFDCHSHETEWPAYASIAPVSWLVQHDARLGAADLDRLAQGLTHTLGNGAEQEARERRR